MFSSNMPQEYTLFCYHRAHNFIECRTLLKNLDAEAAQNMHNASTRVLSSTFSRFIPIHVIHYVQKKKKKLIGSNKLSLQREVHKM